MLLEQISNPVVNRGMQAVARATIKATPKVFGFFADQTYANKPLAICRELTSNAIDAHTAAGCGDQPVEVWLPTDLNPTFCVKDQGIGMSHEFMMTGFLAYTDGSTKDGSNQMIGGFGIGSKSPFAYTDQFTIKSAHNGQLSIYTMFKDDEGIPSVGLLSQSPTSEANGVEVSFPVEQADFEKFHGAADQALKFFTPLPIVHGGKIEPPHYITTGKNWGMRAQSGELAVIMGGVRYPVSTQSLDHEVRYDETIRNLFDYGLDITLPIGTCGVALSREGLSYDDRTSLAIREALLEIVAEIKASFATMFDAYPTRWEAIHALRLEMGGARGARSEILREAAFYKGEKLEDYIMLRAQEWEIPALESNRRNKYNPRIDSKMTAKWESGLKRVFPGSEDFVFIDDLPQEPSSKTVSRIKHYILENSDRKHSSTAYRPNHNSTVAELIAQLGDIPRSEYILTSELDIPPAAPRKAAWKGSRPQVRMYRTTGSDQKNSYGNYRPLTKVGANYNGCFEIDYADQPTTGILVVLDNFTVPASLYAQVRSGLILWEELYFVNKSDAPKLKDWISVDTVFAERLAKVLSDDPDLEARLALSADPELRDVFKHISILGDFPMTPAQAARPFGRIVSLFRKYLEPLRHDQTRLMDLVTPTLPAGVHPAKLYEAFKTKQPKTYRMMELTSRTAYEDKDLFLESI